MVDNRIVGLDIIRSVAILVVIWVHGKFILINAGLTLTYDYARKIDGVTIFFVLSGFLIGGIIMKLFDSGTVKWSGMINFWIRRWWRTLPLYFLILIVHVLFRYFIVNDLSDFSWKFLFFLQNFMQPYDGFFFLESWSLSVEEWFYLFIPLITWVSFLTLNKYFSSKCIALSVIITLLFVLTGFRVFKAISFIPEDHHLYDIFYRKMVVFRMDSILWGVLGAYVKYYYPLFWQKLKLPSLIFAPICLLFFATIHPLYNTFYACGLLFTTTSISILLFFPFMDQIIISHSLVRRGFKFISEISYSLYLIHSGIVLFLMNFYFTPYLNKYPLQIFFVYLILCFVISYFTYTFFEKPILSFRDKHKYYYLKKALSLKRAVYS